MVGHIAGQLPDACARAVKAKRVKVFPTILLLMLGVIWNESLTKKTKDRMKVIGKYAVLCSVKMSKIEDWSGICLT